MILRKNKVEEFWSGVTSACNGLEWGLGSQPGTEVVWWRWKHQVLATRPVVSDKGPGLWLWRKEFPQRWKVVKQVFIGRKKYSTCGQTHGQTQRASPWFAESHPCGSVNYFYGTFLPSFLCPIILICLVTVCIWDISGSSHVCSYISATMDSTAKACG